MENDASKHFINAAQKLNQANQELFKPGEDIVTYLVCKNSQYAIENYLKGYLIKNDIDTSGLITITQLLEACKKINKRFGDIDFSEINCKSMDTNTRFCNETSKVNNCFDVADNLDTFLRKEKII